MSQTSWVKGTAPHLTVLTSDTSCKLEGPQATCAFDQLATILGSSRHLFKFNYSLEQLRTQEGAMFMLVDLL